MVCLVLEGFLLAHATRVLRQFKALCSGARLSMGCSGHEDCTPAMVWGPQCTPHVSLPHSRSRQGVFHVQFQQPNSSRTPSTAQNFLPKGYQGVACGKNLAWTGRARGLRPHWSGRGLPVLTSFRTGCDSWPMLEGAKQSRLLLLLPLVEPPCMYSHQHTRFEDQPPHLQYHGAQSLSKLRSITLQSIALLIGCLKVAPPNRTPCLPLTTSEVH